MIFSGNCASGRRSLSEVFTFLKKTVTVDAGGAEVVDLANSIYIDWGAFINAVITFFITAVVIFLVMKVVNAARDAKKKPEEPAPAPTTKKCPYCLSEDVKIGATKCPHCASELPAEE